MRIVLDTNVLVSGTGWKGGAPARIVDAWSAQRFEIVVSSEIFEEYSRVLTELSERHSGIDAEPVLALIASKAIWVTPVPLGSRICTDPDDDMFIAAAIGGKARYIVSGDRALLAVRSFQGVDILTPARFLAVLPH